ncbi:MAG: tRNA (guanosine(37)-N1)-methyltransferase TrmD [Alphaproteobacteria bacterium]|jgi:tRNA (guanine37-N1)-methyltransferase|nr:tRNA (guanosine(37)-N1)-methyltransferase TrmD [Alphaproteobacteria bacterium]
MTTATSLTTKAWKATVLTLFPEMFPGPLGHSLSGKALEEGLWSLDPVQIRDFATDKHHSVDDTCFGGGAGMILRPNVVDAALEHVMSREPSHGKRTLIFLTPRGKPLDQATVRRYASSPGVVLLCGRYEGIDNRVIEHWQEKAGLEEVSIGDYVLSGGEMAALTLLDACIRLLSGVIGKEESSTNESFELGLLEYPQYTRPQVWESMSVPEVLLSGDHKKIAAWRNQEALRITQIRRPDLWVRYLEQMEKK